MKAIVRVLKRPGSARALLRYCYRKRQRDDAVSKREVSAIESICYSGYITGDPAVDGVIFESRCRRGFSESQHVVISAEKKEEGVNAKLLKAGHEWARRFAPRRSYVVVVHSSDVEGSHPHAHLIVENYGPKGTGLKFSRADLREMAALTFTQEFQAVRFAGSPSPTKGAAQVYPHARRLMAREVAELLLKNETWGSLLGKKLIVPAREKNGKPMSFIYREQRLRVATVERLVATERARRAQREVATMARKAARRGIGGLFDLVGESVDEMSVSSEKPKTRGYSR